VKQTVYIILSILICWACSEDYTGPYNEDLVFKNSFQIYIPAYQYEFGEVDYFVNADTSYPLSFTDTLNNSPVFIWDSMGIDLLTLAIFSSPIRVMNNEIVNKEDLVWQWYLGMEMHTESGSGREGYVQYSDGRNVIHETLDTIDYANPATPLSQGHYFWAIWGWDHSGTRVWYSSQQMEFYVTN
jgi:hypothetical protein